MSKTKRNHILISARVMLLFLGLTLMGQAFAKKTASNPLKELRMNQGDKKQNEVHALKTELLVRKTERLAIKQTKKLLNKYRGSHMEPELWFRLSELYIRKAKSDRFFELHRKSETVTTFAPRLVTKASSRRNVRKAIDIYSKIEQNFPQYESLDLIIFNHAFAQQGLGHQKMAEKNYWILIQKFPKSPLVPDCHLAIGEIAFNQKRFKHALEHFHSINKYPKSRVFPYSKYKAAWTYYNMNNTLAGIKELEKVVAYGEMVAKKNIDARLDLREEALADMTLFYEDVYPADEAYGYFAKHTGDLELGPIILRLASIYDRHARYKEKQIILQVFDDKRPESKFRPEVNDELVQNFDNMRERSKAIAQLRKFDKICNSEASWIEAQKDKSKEVFEDCKARINLTSRRLAAKWLRLWKKNPTYSEFAESAEQGFKIYLSRNAESKKANKIRFILAELLFQREKYREASSYYAQVSRSSKEKKLSHDADYAAILSLEKAIIKEDPKKTEHTKWDDKDEKTFHQLATIYTKNHPKGKYRLDIEFKLSLIDYEKGRYDQAAKSFLKLGELFPNAKKGLKAQDLYLDIMNLKRDYKSLKLYAKKLMRTKKMPMARRAKLKKIYEESFFLQIQSLEEKGKIKLAIKDYNDFAQQNPSSALAERALWNAMQLHFKSYDFKGGASAAVKYYRKYPKNKKAMEVLLKAAQTYESMGQLESAARVLVQLSKIDKKSKWLSLAADFYYVLGKNIKAIAIYTKLKDEASGDMAFHALKQLAEIEKKSINKTEYKKLLQEILKSNHQPESSLALLEYLKWDFEKANYPRAFKRAKQILSMSSKASRQAKAKARFIQAQILESEFRKQSVKTSMERLVLVLSIKTEKLEKTQRAYQSAIRYGEPAVVIASLEQLSAIYHHYVKVLRDMPLPKGVVASEEIAFRNEMEKLAIPMEEKGVETMLQALKQAKKLELRDGSVTRIQSKLDRFNMSSTDTSHNIKIEPPGILVPAIVEVGS